MKKIFAIMLVIGLMISVPMALAEEDFETENDLAEILNDNTSLDDLVLSALGEETTAESTETETEVEDNVERPRGLQMALLQIRYALTNNAESKSELGLRIAEARLLLAQERLREGNPEASSRALEQNQRVMEQVRNHLQRVPEDRTETGKMTELQTRIELQRALTMRLRENTANDDSLNAETRERLENRLREINSVTENARNDATEKREQIRERTQDTNNETDIQTEREVLENTLGQQRAAEVMIRSAAYAHNRTRNLYQRLQETDAYENISEDRIQTLRGYYAESAELLANAKEAYDSENYEEAKRLAIESRLRMSRLNSFMMSNAQQGVAQVRERIREEVRERIEVREEDSNRTRVETRIRIEERIRDDDSNSNLNLSDDRDDSKTSEDRQNETESSDDDSYDLNNSDDYLEENESSDDDYRESNESETRIATR